MKRLVCLLCSILITVSLTACGGAPADTQPSDDAYTKEDPLVLRFNTGVKGEGQTGSRAIMAFRDALETSTDGRVQVEIYWNQVLANSTESVVGGIQADSFQGSEWPVASFGEYSTAFMPLDVPYLISSEEMLHEVLTGEIGAAMAEKFREDTGLRVVGYLDIGFRHITSSKNPVITMDDLSGVKLRLQSNPLHMMAFEAFGALPTQVAFPELFTALQTKTVDAQENPLNLIYREKFYEVQDYLTLTYHLCNVAAFVMNDQYIESLPQDIQDAIDAAFSVSLEASAAENTESQEQWLQEMSQYLEVNEMSDKEKQVFAETSQSLLSDMAEVAGGDYFESITEQIAELGK